MQVCTNNNIDNNRALSDQVRLAIQVCTKSYINATNKQYGGNQRSWNPPKQLNQIQLIQDAYHETMKEKRYEILYIDLPHSPENLSGSVSAVCKLHQLIERNQECCPPPNSSPIDKSLSNLQPISDIPNIKLVQKKLVMEKAFVI